MPPRELPEDIWIDIVRIYVSGRDEASCLALTNKLIRRHALPKLYHQLVVTFDEIYRDEDTALSRLLRICRRVEFLREQKDLLTYVREFKLYFVSPFEWQKSYMPLWSSTYHAVTSLLLTLPHIQRLELHHCFVTPRLRSYIHHHTALKSLTFWVCGSDSTTPTCGLDEPTSLRLEDLTYRQRTSWPFPCQLLVCSMSSLTSLTIPHAEAARVAATTGQLFPSLKSLTIKTYPSDANKSSDISILLKSCPTLHSLDIRALGPGLRPGHVNLEGFPEDALPHLHSVGGDLHIVSTLVPGRPIQRISLYDINSSPIQTRDVHLLRRSTVHTTELTVEVSKMSSISEEQLKHLGAAFCHLSSLRLYIALGRRNAGQVKGIVNVVMPALPQWTELKALLLFVKDFPKVTSEFMQEYVQPPRGGVKGRGRSLLEEIGFTSDEDSFAWLWFPEDGWVLRGLEKWEEEYLSM